MLQLEKYVNSKYKKEIERIKQICLTAENFIFELLCKQQDEIDVEMDGMRDIQKLKIDFNQVKKD
jgi:hypothetical protein